jgi:hypothetical protein
MSEPQTRELPQRQLREDDGRADTTRPDDDHILRSKINGQTTEHATPPRLEDEGQSGG